MMGVKQGDLWELIATTLIGTDFFDRKLPPDGMTDLEYRLINRVRAENYYRIKKELMVFQRSK